jgi:osmotically-inducible protein OsmY
MTRPWRISLFGLTVISCLACAAGSIAQTTTRPATRPLAKASSDPGPARAVASALRANPVTAPYAIVVGWRNGVVELSGRVATKQVHDVAVRLAIDLGAPFRDNLIIDTGEAFRVAAAQSGAAANYGYGYPSANQTYTLVNSSAPYVYPPPLMGRLDDPFYGYVPPLLSFPPWWRRRSELEPPRAESVPQPAARAPAAAPGQPGNPPASGWKPFAVDPVKGQVEVTVDAAGQVFLRGVVVSEEVRREIEEAARSVPGVTRVESQFEVQPRRAEEEPPIPPDPRPAEKQAGGDPIDGLAVRKPVHAMPVALDRSELTERVLARIEQRADGLPIGPRIRSADGVVTLDGNVPTAYEAMLVYRATQQTPGVQDIIDHLEFAVPDEDHPNPLLRKGRPEDIEPYLGSQIRRNIAELARLERVKLDGNKLVIHATIDHPVDKNRVTAILRSIPVLRGFEIQTELTRN